jgi:hypothetical protein
VGEQQAIFGNPSEIYCGKARLYHENVTLGNIVAMESVFHLVHV